MRRPIEPIGVRGTGSLGLTLLVLAATGCGVPGPEGYLPTPTEAGSHAFGGWIELRISGTPEAEVLEGELLAASADTLWILGVDGAWNVPTSAVLDGELTGYDPQAGRVAILAVLGTLSTASNGGFLIFTAPAWILTGIFASRGQANLPRISLPPEGWLELAPFSRFPQGLPEDLDPARLVGSGPGDSGPPGDRP